MQHKAFMRYLFVASLDWWLIDQLPPANQASLLPVSIACIVNPSIETLLMKRALSPALVSVLGKG